MAKKLPKPYQEADGWAFRLRRGDVDIYKSGFKSQAAARAALTELAVGLEGNDKPALMGPFKTSVAVGLMDYARERLPYLKGARQEANRISRYLQQFMLRAYAVTDGAGKSLFAFKLHQFIAGGGKVYTTLQAPGHRAITLDGQQFVSGDDERQRRYYPVGYFLFWQTGAEGADTKVIGDTNKQKTPSLLIVDGQQRLTSLYAVIRREAVLRESFEREHIRIAFRPQNSAFAVPDATTERDPECRTRAALHGRVGELSVWNVGQVLVRTPPLALR